jgi:tetratricopeptide (TPR) repeat protein
VARRYALIARASFHGELLQERSARGGEPLQIGGTPTFAVPMPEGVPYLARILWTSPSTAAVRDGAGIVHHVEPGRDVVIDVGPLEVRVSVVERFSLRRTEPLAAVGSVAWLLVVVMITALTAQYYWVRDHGCDIAFSLLPGLPDLGLWIAAVVAPLVAAVIAVFVILGAEEPRRALPALGLPVLALLVPVVYWAGGFSYRSGDEILVEQFAECFPSEEGGEGLGGPVTAEYLARLLRNDLEGEDQGAIETDIERPEAERKLGERDIFLPAGADGPITRMGGAEQVAPDPVRTLVSEDRVAVPSRESEAAELVSEDGRPVQQPDVEDDNDGAADGLDVPREEDAEGREAPAEEHEGWGLQAWYDEEDEAMDQLEIELMLRAANNRLRIDPDDPAALSILSYYQYLAQDYEAAKKTYDRFIELYPNDAAGYNNKALVYKREGEYQKEEGLYRVALSLSPNDVTAMNNLGVNLAHQRRFPEALAVMETLEIIDPNDPYADLHRSKIHAEMGQEEEALAYLDLALQGMERLDTLHHIEFRQDIRLDPSFAGLRDTYRFREILQKYYGKDSPLQE